MSSIVVTGYNTTIVNNNEDNRKAHGWVFPPSPVLRFDQILVGMTDALAEEIIEIIREDCTDENGNMITEGNAPELLQFAARLENNLAQKAMRKSTNFRE